jgi:Uma2 family endonuclease
VTTAVRRATYEDVLGSPPEVVAELIYGVLHTHPRPAPRHAVATTALGAEVHSLFQRGRGGPGGWIILFEPELHLGGEPDVLVPDIAGWRREHMPELPDTAYFTTAPDWVCEVLSPSTQTLDRGAKMDIYKRERVAHVWLVDPIARTLEAYQHSEPGWVRLGAWHGDVEVRVDPFETMAIDLKAIWSP